MSDITAEPVSRVRETAAMLQGLAPRIAAGRWEFLTVPDGALPPDALASFREDEGLSVIVPARAEPQDGAWAQITLDVHSALDGIGLTAAVSTALAAEGIPCNMVAANHHDHVFVPEARAAAALAVLEALAHDTRQSKESAHGRTR